MKDRKEIQGQVMKMKRVTITIVPLMAIIEERTMTTMVLYFSPGSTVWNTSLKWLRSFSASTLKTARRKRSST